MEIVIRGRRMDESCDGYPVGRKGYAQEFGMIYQAGREFFSGYLI